jgi:hypothetical protein
MIPAVNWYVSNNMIIESDRYDFDRRCDINSLIWLVPCSVCRSRRPRSPLCLDAYTTARGMWLLNPSLDRAVCMTGFWMFNNVCFEIDVVGRTYDIGVRVLWCSMGTILRYRPIVLSMIN